MTGRRDGDYWRNGFVRLEAFMPREVGVRLLAKMKADLERLGLGMGKFEKGCELLRRPAPEIYGYEYPQIASFHWGMTPAVADLTGEDLLPTYAYFRLYRQGDICRVHSDRFACEHSITLLLANSDGLPWDIEIAREPSAETETRVDDRFDPEDRAVAVPMQPGDAVLYQGICRRHGRTTPNPNAWSAHLFLHWITRGGRYDEEAFDRKPPPGVLVFE